MLGKAKVGLIGWLTFILMLVSNYMIFIYSPLEKFMREVQKIFYVHVGTAWNAFLAFAVVFVASIIYLRTKNKRWDRIAAASAELGVLFTTITLLMGTIWGRSAWNTWWTWEPRLTATLVLWFMYIGYLVIRASVVEEQRRATLAAAFGIIGFLDVPIVYISVKLWGSHPLVFGNEGGGLHPQMLQTLIMTVFAFTALYLYFMNRAITIQTSRDKLDGLKQTLRDRIE